MIIKNDQSPNAIYFDENVWLSQKIMGRLYNVETHTINYHLKKIFTDGELDEQPVIRKFRITASDGKGCKTNHYNLKSIIAWGNKVDSPRVVEPENNYYRKLGLIVSNSIRLNKMMIWI